MIKKDNLNHLVYVVYVYIKYTYVYIKWVYMAYGMEKTL